MARKTIKVKIIEESLWDRLPQHVKDEINGIINYKPKEMVEVVHGKWIPHQDLIQGEIYDGHRCSVCGTWKSALEKYNYCPNCGAKMDGDK